MDTGSTTCPDLTVPAANVMISYNMGTTSLRPVNTVATYTCVTGYTLNGDSTRTCGSDGVWSGPPPTCQGEWNDLVLFLLNAFTISGTCFDLPPLMNGVITYTAGPADSRPINTIATFTCDNGYTLTGGSFRQCLNDGTWSATAPTCQCEFHYILTVASFFYFIQ